MCKTQKTNPTAKMFKQLVEAGEVNFDLPMQRGYVWSREKKTKLIESIFLDYPIPPLYANFKNGVYYIVDGQQRGKTIAGFQQNKFALGQLSPFSFNGTIYNLSGKKFNELPQELHLEVEQFNMDLHYKENMTDDEQNEMFIRLNYGKPLSATEMTKAQIKSIGSVTQLAKHSVFKKIMNEKGIEASKNASLVMQTYVAIFEENKSMLSSAIKRALGEKQISDIQKEHIKDCLDIFSQAYETFLDDKTDISKKLTLIFKRKSHFIAFIYTISQAIQDNSFDINILIEWCKHFFDCEVDQTTICDEYNLCLKENMNSDEAVTTRLVSMFNDYQQYIVKVGE